MNGDYKRLTVEIRPKNYYIVSLYQLTFLS